MIGVFHPGTQHSWQTARALDELGHLSWYATEIYWRKRSFPYSGISVLPAVVRRKLEWELSRFYHPKLNSDRVHSFIGYELLARVASRLGASNISPSFRRLGNRLFSQKVGTLVRKTTPKAIWGYDISSLEVFRAVKEGGTTLILDRTIGHPAAYNTIIRAVFEQYSEFFLTKDIFISPEHIERINEEHALADYILVGSDFSYETMQAHQPLEIVRRVHLLNYCYDDIFFSASRVRKRVPGTPLKFLFVGYAGPRKGIHLLLRVFEKLSPKIASLSIVGGISVPQSTWSRYSDRVSYLGNLPRHKVSEHMLAADCLIYPSYFEGAGLSVYEAMATGLPVIQTANMDRVIPQISPLFLKDITESELQRAIDALVSDVDLLESESRRNLDAARAYTFSTYTERIDQFLRLISISFDAESNILVN